MKNWWWAFYLKVQKTENWDPKWKIVQVPWFLQQFSVASVTLLNSCESTLHLGHVASLCCVDWRHLAWNLLPTITHDAHVVVKLLSFSEIIVFILLSHASKLRHLRPSPFQATWPTGRRWSPFQLPSARYQLTLRDHWYRANALRGVSLFTSQLLGWYQIILLGDRGTWV